MRNLPSVNNSAVAAAPNHTSPQLNCTSGSSLKISANSSVTNPSEMRKLIACHSRPAWHGARRQPFGQRRKAALITKDTKSRKPTPKTTENDRNRSRIMFASVRPGFGVTRQMVLRAS